MIPQTQDNTQVNILNYLRIFFRRKWFFIIPVVIALAVAFFVANILPKVYESYTVILVEEEKFDNPIIQGLAISTSAAQRLRNLREQILGWTRLVKLADKLGMTKDIKNQRQFEGLILNDLRKNIYVSMRGPSLVRIAFRSEAPEKAQLVTKTISDIFVEENIASQNKESDIAITFLQEQLKVYHRKIKESEIAQKEEQLNALLIDSTEEHPMVKDIRTKIAKAREDMIKEEARLLDNPEFIRNPVYSKLQQNLQKEVAAIKSAKALTGESDSNDAQSSEEDLYKVALMSTVTDAFARDLGVNQTIYNMLLQRLETAKISKSLEASKEGTRYTVLDPPRLPLEPIKPNKFMVVLMGGFLGGVLGAGLILLLELLDNSFLGVDEAKALLDRPVLGAISKIMTLEDMAKEKAKRTMRLGITISASAAFVFIVIIYSIIAKP
ncbi:MAG: hypothetical protein KKC66_03895 [Candidatus Omnitrophica bacterium]|nr:hypothetical protein [Candidatus Omnitrophota bacterium]